MANKSDSMKKKKISDPEIVKSDILKMLERRLKIYENGPFIFEYSVEVVKEDCSCSDISCSDKHNTVEIHSSFLLRDELLDICKYTKKNGFGLLYKGDMFTVVMD